MRLLLFFAAFSFSAIAMGQLVSTELIESFTADEVQDIASSFSLPNDVIPLNYGVDFYRVEYMTPHPMGMDVLVSGAIAVPQGVSCPRAIASYQHGTVAAKENVPSRLNDEGLLGVLYASTGFVCTMPDYIGLGSSDVFHLYVHAESQATASLDLIRLASGELQEELGYSWAEQLFLYGYSQGGHATMALHQYIETYAADEFTVTASAPMSGPYDISGTQTDMLIAEVPFSAPGYLPYVVLSYQSAYGNLYDSLSQVFIEPYASEMWNWFDGENSMGFISSQMLSIPTEMLVPEFYGYMVHHQRRQPG
ncbi:MAG: lipase family protein [Bacteroidota bacterium]